MPDMPTAREGPAAMAEETRVCQRIDAQNLYKYLSNISDLNSKILYKEAIKDFRWDLNKNEWVARLMQ